MSVIETVGLTKSYGGRRGIQDVSLSVTAGEIFGFLGPNGSGKSTTIRILMGFLRASSGTAKILGADCWKSGQSVRQQCGYVAGDVRLYPWLTTRRALGFIGQVRGIDLMPGGLALAERFRLEVDLPVRQMSRGNRQKVALVLALVHRPPLIILDEPTSGLDPIMQDTLATCLREAAGQGRTVFFSSHTLSEVEVLCDRVAIVRDGAIVANERLDVLRQSAPRTVTVVFESTDAASAVEWPDFISFRHRDRARCQLHMNGEAGRLIAWAAQQPIRDIDISPPSLEAVFRSHYEESDSSENGTDS